MVGVFMKSKLILPVKRSEVLPVISLAFPDYAGRRISISVGREMILSNLNWCEGNKSDYVAVDLNGFTGARLVERAPWLENREGVECSIPVGIVIVERRYSGSHISVMIHVREENAESLLKSIQFESKF